MKDLYELYGDDFVCISWYLNGGYDIPESSQRFSWYGFSGTPSAMFDGLEGSVGGYPSGSMFDTYDPMVQGRFAVPSPVEIMAAYTNIGNQGSVSVNIQSTEAIPSGNYDIEFVVIENYAHDQINMARVVLASEPLTISGPGESQVVTRDFTLDAGWVTENVRVVVFVQDQTNPHDVLQATYSVADYAGVVNVDTDPNGLSAPWHLSGPEGFDMNGTGDASMFVFTAGDYTLTWLDVEYWETPTPVSTIQTLVEDGEIDFAGYYTGGLFAADTTGELGDAGSAQGVAAIDYDLDGDIDIHVIRDGVADMLLENNGGSFTNIAGGTLLGDTGAGRAVTWADYDNDGDMDAYLSKDGLANVLLTNDGGVFSSVTSYGLNNVDAGMGASWVDYDHDGLLDLYLVNNGTDNKLFHAYGDPGIGQWIFLAGSATVADSGPGMTGVWSDYDNDGDQDLFVVNYLGANLLFDNDPQYGFFDATGSGALPNIGRGTGAAWGDYDNDGDMDLYFANDGAADIFCEYHGGSFNQQIGAPLGDTGNTKGVAWGDFDNDGDLDLYLAKHGQYDRILRNDAGTFVEVALGVNETGGNANGMAWADFNDDGKLDAYVANDNGQNVMLVNGVDNGNHWLKVKLTGDTVNKSAVGARVTVTAGGRTMVREVTTSTGYLSQAPLMLHFGLGAATTVDAMTVYWPGEGTTDVTVAAVDQLINVNQGGGPSAVDPAPSRFALHQCYPNPFNPSTTISYELPQAGEVTLRLYDVSGSLITTLKNGVVEAAGLNSVVWNGTDDSGKTVSAGVYFCNLKSGSHEATVRMVMVK
ncbi:T9SS type A sorting domain-containing protein [bacterium]|nr:T9SS type A sorting domain-containing protein [bacterium]